MLDPAIIEFFNARKEDWLKKNLKPSMSDEEIAQKKQECEEKFALLNWQPDAAKRAGQISLATHPCTLSHPSARKNKNGYVSSIIANNKSQADGFLRTGNVEVETDALGNAAALDVYKFLTLVMQDGQTLLEHIEQETELAKALLNQPDQNYQALRDGFLQMVQSSKESITSSKIKQVYFYIADEDNYHLLSTLTNSGLVFELRKRLDKLRFSEETQKARECRKNNQFFESSYKEIFDLTTIGYGGTKPQNISVLNNKNGGKAHLLLSAPPSLKARDVRVPTTSFFKETFSPWQAKYVFYAFHQLISRSQKLISRSQNNVGLREKRAEIIQEYMDLLLQKMWQLRGFLENHQGKLDALDGAQHIWLAPEHQEMRMNSDDWLEDIVSSISLNFTKGYKRVLGDKCIKFGDVETLTAIKDVVKQNQEALR